MQIIVSMAGLGIRFSNRGFKTPKHLIKIENSTLIEYAINTLNIDGQYIFIIRLLENNEYNIELINILKKIKPECKIIKINYISEGPASSCYLAKNILDLDDELIISNCDQILEWDSKRFLNETRKNNLDCSVLTYNSNDPKNSFIKCSDNNIIATEIIEKNPISNNALVGVHYFKKAKYFTDSYEEIFEKKIKTNSEYYLSNVCNNLISKYTVGHILLDENNSEKYHSTGTPDCFFKYLNHIKQLNIKKYNLNEMFRGWFIGNFEPSVFKSSCIEVGYLFHKKGEIWNVHYHNNLIEVNLLVKGKMILNNMEINENEIFVINQKEIACPIFLEDCNIVCIKIPNIVGDKINI